MNQDQVNQVVTAGASGVVIALFVIGLVLNFLPTILAFIMKSPHKLRIFIVNFFLGWTIVGWIVALVWAFERAPQTIVIHNHLPVKGELGV